MVKEQTDLTVKKQVKYLFVVGGVVSGLGKGICTASIARLLKNSGLKVFIIKMDPYLNTDAGTMNPNEHGEVFVTGDGAETDLDLGHYERFVNLDMEKRSNVTAGKIYQNVIDNERKGKYYGATTQVIPHVTNEIKRNIFNHPSDVDIVIIEIGGTIGDIESRPFIEAVRQIIFERGKDNVLLIAIMLLLHIHSTYDEKTKPIQHAVNSLMSLGVHPDFIFLRSKLRDVDLKTLKKISWTCNIKIENIIIVRDVKIIYKVVLDIFQQKFIVKCLRQLQIKERTTNIKAWLKFIAKIENSKKIINVALIYKYKIKDAYLSVTEALKIAGYENQVCVNIDWINAEDITEANYQTIFKSCKAILIPGGFDIRGISGKIFAAKYAREKRIPFLGICLGMQVAIIEFMRNVCGLSKANSTEFDKNTPINIFDILKTSKNNSNLGGTLRLGNFVNDLKPESLIAKCYQKTKIIERHRHRYEVNNNR